MIEPELTQIYAGTKSPKEFVKEMPKTKAKQLREFYLENQDKLKNISALMLTNISVLEKQVLSLDKEQSLEEWEKISMVVKKI